MNNITILQVYNFHVQGFKFPNYCEETLGMQTFLCLKIMNP